MKKLVKRLATVIVICVAAFLIIRYTDLDLRDMGIDFKLSDYWRDESADGITSIA